MNKIWSRSLAAFALAFAPGISVAAEEIAANRTFDPYRWTGTHALSYHGDHVNRPFDTFGCREQDAIVGIFGRSGYEIDFIEGIVCQAVRSDGVLHGNAFRVSHGAPQGLGGSPYELRCPAGQFVVGLSGRSGGRLDALTLRCGTGGAAKDGTIVGHNVTTISGVGGPGGQPFTDDCPNHQPLLAVRWFRHFDSEYQGPSSRRVYSVQGFCRQPPHPKPVAFKNVRFDVGGAQPAYVRPGDKLNLLVEYDRPAGKGDQLLIQRLEVSGQSPFEGLPYNYNVPLGQTRALLPTHIVSPPKFGTIGTQTIRVSSLQGQNLAGDVKETRLLIVPPDSIQISNVQLSTDKIWVGQTITMTVNIDRPAPDRSYSGRKGLPVRIQPSSGGVITAGSQTDTLLLLEPMIPPGATSVTVQLPIKAKAGGNNLALTVKPGWLAPDPNSGARMNEVLFSLPWSDPPPTKAQPSGGAVMQQLPLQQFEYKPK